MNIYSAKEVAEKLPWDKLMAAIAGAFRNPPTVPQREHHDIDPHHPGSVSLLTMPAWRSDEYIGVKLVNVVPENRQRNIPTVLGSYVLMSATTGESLAIIDAPELTARRTAAASSLAADTLARKNAKTHLVVGAGKLAPYFAESMRTIRALDNTLVWARNSGQAQAIAKQVSADVVEDLEEAVQQADIISCVTTTTMPLIDGPWLSPGCHLDLVGAFRPDMREVDDKAIERASIFVDTREGAMTEAGELADPLNRGLISEEDVQADLAELVTGKHPGRLNENEITLFKSVGTAIEDYAAAVCLMNENKENA